MDGEVKNNEVLEYDDFAKVSLRVALIRSAERVEGSEKLLKLGVSLGKKAVPAELPAGGDSEAGGGEAPVEEIEEVRQILAGIGKRYEPAELIGRRIIIVANLKPRKLMGLESQGMLLAADGADGPELLSVADTAPPGASIR